MDLMSKWVVLSIRGEDSVRKADASANILLESSRGDRKKLSSSDEIRNEQTDKWMRRYITRIFLTFSDGIVGRKE